MSGHGRNVLADGAPFVCLGLLLAAASACWPTVAAGQGGLPDAEWAKMDAFEANRLAKADQLFNQKNYRAAIPAYQAFRAEFPKSRALAYVLFREARAWHLDEKRFQAVKAYEEVLDYFPDLIDYAAPALFHIGECHSQSGDLEKAMKAWHEMATDKDYRKHPLAAIAVNALADNLVKQKKAPEAMTYYEQVALDFKFANRDPAFYALDRLVDYFVAVTPSEDKLRTLYKQRGGFDRDPIHLKKEDDPALDRRYWTRLWEKAWALTKDFGEDRQNERKRVLRYWADTFEGKHEAWDEFQVQQAGFRRESSGDVARWYKRMDEIFAARYKDGDVERVFAWLAYLRGHKEKLTEYAAKLDVRKLNIGQLDRLLGLLAPDNLHAKVFMEYFRTVQFDQMSNEEIEALAMTVYGRMSDIEMGRNTAMKIKLAKMQDEQKSALSRRLWKTDGFVVRWVCQQFDDKDFGRNELLEFYHKLGKKVKIEGMQLEEIRKERLDVASHLTGVEKYAAGAWWKKACFLHWDGKYEEAIQAYRTADNPPDNLWPIVECLVALGRFDQAVQELLEIENFFQNLAPKAALMVADVYGRAGRRNEQVGALRKVMKKYSKSGESNSAHMQLEKMGIKIGGGTDAE